MAMFIINTRHASFEWSHDLIKEKLTSLSEAKKGKNLIKMDLSSPKLHAIGRFFWKIIRNSPFLTRLFFGVDLERTREILDQLKPLVNGSDLKNIYGKAIKNFCAFAPNAGRKKASYIHFVETMQFGSGQVNSKIQDVTFQKIKLLQPQGIIFNPEKKVTYIEGGVCTAMAFGFLNKCLNKLKVRENNSQVLSEVAKEYEKGGDKPKLFSIQAAMNCIEVDKTIKNVDFSRAKIQALANLYNLKITAASEELSLKDGISGVRKAFDTLERGDYVIREIEPRDNEKLEFQGHTMILMKRSFGTFFFDPNKGLRMANDESMPDILFDAMESYHTNFGVDHSRFYKLESKEKGNKPVLV